MLWYKTNEIIENRHNLHMILLLNWLACIIRFLRWTFFYSKRILSSTFVLMNSYVIFLRPKCSCFGAESWWKIRYYLVSSLIFSLTRSNLLKRKLLSCNHIALSHLSLSLSLFVARCKRCEHVFTTNKVYITVDTSRLKLKLDIFSC